MPKTLACLMPKPRLTSRPVSRKSPPIPNLEQPGLNTGAHGSVYRRLFPKSTAMNSKAMVNEIEEMGRRLALIHSQRFKKVLLFDNAAPHREQVSTDKLGQLGYVHMPHPPYLLDISPCDYHYYLSLQDFLVGRDTRTVLDNHIEQLINTRLKQFCKDGVRKLTER
ncbi:unnamed protein product [Heligmosomoides polygyrus]|uniref:DDE_3 domain-containing protein n=1 Tax=Heligmosomoides polygyrus TaxID=6339 RepID=A0A183G482_HELPZ|nr:unnamed protein product [Heligmosomoides polygyrus]